WIKGEITMRLLLAMFKHETNTFSPVPTPFQRFFNNSSEIFTGELARKVYQDTGTGLGGFLKVGDQYGAIMDIAIAASARPSGVMSKETYVRLCNYILDAVAGGGYDGILLDLHGAMVAEGF